MVGLELDLPTAQQLHSHDLPNTGEGRLPTASLLHLLKSPLETAVHRPSQNLLVYLISSRFVPCPAPFICPETTSLEL